MPTPSSTIDELVATLKRSSIPTVIVEGGDDVAIYRWVEEKIGVGKADFLPCGGRDALLKIYERRHEFSQLPTAFVADKDMWLFTSVPDEYKGIIWTTGYSVENDLYAGSKLNSLLDSSEAENHAKVLGSLIEWFAFEVEEYRKTSTSNANIHPNRVVPLGQTEICPQFIAARGFKPPKRRTVREVTQNCKLKVRGKTLFALLERYVSAPKRHAKHSVKGLCEIAFKTQPTHKYMTRIISEVEKALSISTLQQHNK